MCFFWTPNSCHSCLLNNRDPVHKNNIDTPRVTNKRYYKKYFSKSFLKNWQILRTVSREIVPDSTSFSLRYEVILSLLAGISIDSTFRAVFDFKKLKIIYWGIYYLLFLENIIFLSIIFMKCKYKEIKS